MTLQPEVADHQHISLIQYIHGELEFWNEGLVVQYVAGGE